MIVNNNIVLKRSTLESSPIKFVGANGLPYSGDYAVNSRTSYITDLGGGNLKILAYDLINMSAVEES